MAAIDDILVFSWPKDPHAQGGAMATWLSLLNALRAEWQDTQHAILQIDSTMPPETADWETAWVNEGRSLPIPDGSLLLWYNTDINQFGGFYLVADGNIVRSDSGATHLRNDATIFTIPDVTLNAVFPTTALTDLLLPVTLNFRKPGYLTLRLPGCVGWIAHGSETSGPDLSVKLSYKIDGVYQIINPAEACPGVMPFYSTHIANEDAVHHTYWEWVHPDLIDAGSHTLEFAGIVPSLPDDDKGFALCYFKGPFNRDNVFIKDIIPAGKADELYSLPDAMRPPIFLEITYP